MKSFCKQNLAEGRSPPREEAGAVSLSLLERQRVRGGRLSIHLVDR